MSDLPESKKTKSSPTPAREKAKYEKPSIKSESLTAVAALCNGTNTGGRKATVGAGCQASKLKS